MKKPITEKQLIELRSQIVLGSLFIADYKNDFGINENIVCDFFEGYLNFLDEVIYEEEENQDLDFWAAVQKYDNNENLIEWFNCFVACHLYIEEEGG